MVQLRDLNPEVPLKDIWVAWSGSHGVIQETGRNVVAPNETLTDTEFIIVLRGDPDPRFANWSMDFDFGSVNPPAGSPAAAAAAEQPATASPEQETVFWQSIVNSANPADFEAYLAQFPGGVFRALAENRLAALSAPAGNAPAAAPDRNPPRGAGSDARAQEQPFRPGAGEPTCAGQAEGAACWMELESHPGCHVWNTNLSAGATATWTAGCGAGLASGLGTLKWVWDGGEQESTGTLRDGKPNGHWVIRSADGTVNEGPYVDGERNGHWVIRDADGDVGEGPLVDGKQNGHWVIRYADGTVNEGPYVDGKQNGHWVIRDADGDVGEGPLVDGERNGHWVLRLASGNVNEGPYVDGKQDGHWVLRYADGAVNEGPYVDGKQNGHWVIRDADGGRPGRPVSGRRAERPLGPALGVRGRLGRPVRGRRAERPLGSCAGRSGPSRKARTWTASGTAVGVWRRSDGTTTTFTWVAGEIQ